MALIKCIECGQEISDMATACPKCGKPTSVRIKHKNPTIAFLGNFLLGGWAGYFYVGEYLLGTIFLIQSAYGIYLGLSQDIFITITGGGNVVIGMIQLLLLGWHPVYLFHSLYPVIIGFILLLLISYDAQEKAKKYNQRQLDVKK